MMTLSVQHLVKRFPNTAHPAVDDVSFELAQGEILALVGPSGCGKTTTLRLIAGLERPDGGTVCLAGRVVASDQVFLPPEQRGIGMVFQDHALFPHLTVSENVAFGLRGKDKRPAAELLQLVGLEALARRYPHALSGGERQRVALARALAPGPHLVLMDEPFSSLDAWLREEMREQVRSLLKSAGATAVFVTHDQEEALFMGDRVAVFNRGKLEQVGSPESVYQNSASRFVVEFMGGGSFVSGVVTAEGILTELGLLAQPVVFPPDTAVDVVARADDIDFTSGSQENGVVLERQYRGMMNIYLLRLDSGLTLNAFKPHTEIYPAGERVRIFIDAGHALSAFKR
jgi:iron(III) transport system ATP-binding protein